MRNEKNRLERVTERFREVLLVLLHCARSSLTLTRAVQRPVQGNPGRRKLAGASANCGILRRKSASSLSASQSGLAGREGVVVPVGYGSGVAAFRGDVAPVLP
ncbi:TPA: hypothetical protein ROR06_003833 [Escherichia coli]|nr:hypothetical protein [Escherichia coli]